MRTLDAGSKHPMLRDGLDTARAQRRCGVCALGLLVAASAGCDRPPLEVQDVAPAFDWLNNPDNGNPSIMRFAEEFAIAWSDAETGLRALHTTFPLGETDCSAQEALDPIAMQLVGNIDPDDFFASELRLRAGGSVWITVRDTNQPGDCFGALLVAEGIGELAATDNDYFGLGDGGYAANTWGYSARGTLLTPAGEALAYEGVWRARSTFAAGGKLLASKVNLH